MRLYEVVHNHVGLTRPVICSTEGVPQGIPIGLVQIELGEQGESDLTGGKVDNYVVILCM